jgi:nitrous oxidase accessory protein
MFLLWSVAAVLAGGPSPVALPARTLIVAPASALSTLKDALRIARDGDTIVVRHGEYHEGPITVDRKVTITGRGLPVFDGDGEQVFLITADSVTLRGLMVRDVAPSTVEDRAGIRVSEAHGCRIEDNRLQDTFFAIYLSKVTGCLVRGNQVSGSGRTEVLSGNAIHSWSSSDLVIRDNVLQGHRDGIYFEFTSGAVVERNRSTGNLRYGLHFMFSNGCAYTGNTFVGNRAGVAVMYSRDVSMRGNRFADSWGGSSYGLLLKDISDSRLQDNLFQRNSIGLFAEGVTRLTVTGNQFLANGWGVQVMADAQSASFRRNRFEGNSFDVSTNSINAASEFSENYWDRYTGYDLNRDGYGDVPFAPVRLFALVVQQTEPALILLRSFFVSLLDAAERVAPVLTPATMIDRRPLMAWPGPGAPP